MQRPESLAVACDLMVEEVSTPSGLHLLFFGQCRLLAERQLQDQPLTAGSLLGLASLAERLAAQIEDGRQ